MAGKDGSQKSVVKKREIAGHAAAGIGQNLVYGLWGSYILIFTRMYLELLRERQG